MTKRTWQELTGDPADIGAHLTISRNHPHSAAGQASTRILLAHYRRAAHAEMLAHHGHMSGCLSGAEFRAKRVDGMLESWADNLKRRILCSADPIGEITRLIGPDDQLATKPKKSKEERRLEGIKF